MQSSNVIYRDTNAYSFLQQKQIPGAHPFVLERDVFDFAPGESNLGRQAVVSLVDVDAPGVHP